MARPTITAVDVDRRNKRGGALAITIRTDQGHATHIDFDADDRAADKMASVLFTVGLERIQDTDELVGRRLMTREETLAWRADRFAELFTW